MNAVLTRICMMTHLEPGTILDERYRITGFLGEGGFGITYSAENMLIGTKTAIKEFFWRGYVTRIGNKDGTFSLSASDPADQPQYEQLREKFLREARILRDFEQESAIVDILDYFEANDTAYMVMEYLDGSTLQNYVRE